MSVKASEQQRKYEEKLDEIIKQTMKQGQLLIIATKRHGKTNTCMHLVRRLRQTLEHRANAIKLKIFDTVLVWRHEFDEIPFVSIDEVRILPEVQDLIVDIPFVDSQLTRNALGEILVNDFIDKRKLKEIHKGKNPYANVYVIEEIQNCLGTYSMNGKQGRFWLKIVSECGNFAMVIIGLGQRFADISTKVVDRTRFYLIGATSGERDLVKIKGIGGKGLADKVRTLKRGEFLFFDKENKETMTLIYFPLFVQKGKPHLHDDSSNGSGYTKEINLS